jgi:DNA-binding response OmpR family regulator
MLLDFKLPDINGTAVCRAVRSDSSFEHMKIIMISGVADPNEVQELLAAGADDFIKKPFNIESLLSRVAEMLHV